MSRAKNFQISRHWEIVAYYLFYLRFIIIPIVFCVCNARGEDAATKLVDLVLY